MKIKQVLEILDGELLTGEDKLDLEIRTAFGTDLMSDCLAFVNENVLLLTGLISPQTVRTAEMMDIQAIAFVRGKVPPDAVIDLAKERGIVVITTKNTMFTSCGKLYTNGLTERGMWND